MTEKKSMLYKWQFSSRFKSHGFGWRSSTPMKRIKEAISEIKKIAKKEPVIAAEGYPPNNPTYHFML